MTQEAGPWDPFGGPLTGHPDASLPAQPLRPAAPQTETRLFPQTRPLLPKRRADPACRAWPSGCGGAPRVWGVLHGCGGHSLCRPCRHLHRLLVALRLSPRGGRVFGFLGDIIASKPWGAVLDRSGAAGPSAAFPGETPASGPGPRPGPASLRGAPGGRGGPRPRVGTRDPLPAPQVASPSDSVQSPVRNVFCAAGSSHPPWRTAPERSKTQKGDAGGVRAQTWETSARLKHYTDRRLPRRGKVRGPGGPPGCRPGDARAGGGPPLPRGQRRRGFGARAGGRACSRRAWVPGGVRSRRASRTVQ